jgi:hypothetical protein
MGWVVNATPRPLYRRERPGTYCIGGRSIRVRKISPPPGFDSWTVQPVAIPTAFTYALQLQLLTRQLRCLLTMFCYTWNLLACGFGLAFRKEHNWNCCHPRLKDRGGCTAFGRIDRQTAFSRWVQSSTSNFSVILPVTLLKCFKVSVNHSFSISVVWYLILAFTSCFLYCVFYDHIQYVAEFLLFVLLVKIVLCPSV